MDATNRSNWYIIYNKNNNKITFNQCIKFLKNDTLTFIAHKNCIGIITHGGWSTVLEAVVYSKPMVLMPLFAGHLFNFF